MFVVYSAPFSLGRLKIVSGIHFHARYFIRVVFSIKYEMFGSNFYVKYFKRELFVVKKNFNSFYDL